MVRRKLLIAALMLAAGLVARAQDAPEAAPPPVPTVTTAASQSFPQVTCTSADALAANDALELAADTRDRLASLLKLGPAWRFAVHIHVLTPDDPLTAKINREASAVFAQGTTMKLEAVVPIDDPNAREFIQRQYVTALLWEKFFVTTTTFDKHTRLDSVPLWLIEGLREWVNEDSDHNRESIVRRAVQSQAAPTLEQVTNWHELSTDRLLGLWQRSFCYYLVDSLTVPGARRDDFQQWLGGFPGSAEKQLHFPTESAWQKELAEASDRSHDMLYTWAQTSDALSAKETITYATAKDARVKTCTLDTVMSEPRSPALIEAVQERIFILTELELRAHPSWQHILEMYRSALAAFVHDDSRAPQLFAQARHWRDEEAQHHEKLVDYINWFEVTRDYADDHSSRFRSYFDAAKEMERIEADPKHPNPIRANLLQIESEL
jgi:hypothetical protein